MLREGTPRPNPVNVPDEVRQIMDANRHATFPPRVENFSYIIEGFLTPNMSAMDDYHFAQRIRSYAEADIPTPAALSHAEIEEELDFLFMLLRYGYGAYGYFGGDAVFAPLHEKIRLNLTHKPNPLSVHDYLHDLLLPALRGAIADNHFWLGWQSVGVRSVLFMNHTYFMYAQDGNYFLPIDGITYLVLETNAQILPTLTRQGSLAYVFGYRVYGLRPDDDANPPDIFVELQNMTSPERYTRSIPVDAIENAAVSHTNVHTLREENGVPILENRRLHDTNERTLWRFQRTGRQLRNEPVLILDLRGHSGGSDGFAFGWIEQYTRFPVRFDMMFTHIRRYSHSINALQPFMPVASPPRWHIWPHEDEPTFIPNENLLIVLTDSAVGSAGDAFVGLLRQLENVLIVGTPTMGVLISGNMGNTILPHSRLDIRFGVSMSAPTHLQPFDGVGFAPDLWVNPNVSLYRVLRFIENYRYPQ